MGSSSRQYLRLAKANAHQLKHRTGFPPKSEWTSPLERPRRQKAAAPPPPILGTASSFMSRSRSAVGAMQMVWRRHRSCRNAVMRMLNGRRPTWRQKIDQDSLTCPHLLIASRAGYESPSRPNLKAGDPRPKGQRSPERSGESQTSDGGGELVQEGIIRVSKPTRGAQSRSCR